MCDWCIVLQRPAYSACGVVLILCGVGLPGNSGWTIGVD